jgi:hypothetical protein
LAGAGAGSAVLLATALLPPQAHAARAAHRVKPLLYFFSVMNVFLFWRIKN